MIANITQGSYVKGLLEYHKDKVEQGKAELFLLNNLLSNNPKYIENTLSTLNFDSKRNDKNIHISLNFVNSDYQLLSEKSKQNIVKDYMKEMGFPAEHPYVVYLHKDKNHPHFHIVSSKILQDKTVLNDSYLHYRSQRLTRKLELKYGLSQVSSIKNPKNMDLTFDPNQLRIIKNEYESGEQSLKKYLANSVQYVLSNQKPIHLNQLESYLKDQGIFLYQTNHQSKGIIFSQSDKTKGIAANQLNKSFVLKELESIFKENKIALEPEIKYIGKSIDMIFYKYDLIDLNTYQKELKKKNIELKLNITNNVVRGMSYVYNGRKYKGQDLVGRRYTQDKIKDKFSNKNQFNELYQVKSRMFIYKDKLDYTNYQLFIKSALESRIRPVIQGGTMYLIPIENQGNLLNISKSVPILNFNETLNSLSSKEIDHINTLIYKDVLIANQKPDPTAVNEKSLDTFDEFIMSDSVSNDISSDEPMRKKSKKRKYNI